jgi:large subunit ribosomal protein L24
MKIKKGDTVIVMTGKDRGKEGVIMRAFPKKQQVLLEGIHVVSRHKKANRRGSVGQIIQKPMPIPVANIALKHGKKGVRVGYIMEGEGEKMKKVRVARPSGEKI